MAPPANTTFATAVNIAVFPYDVTQSDINDAGTNFTVYYKFIAPANARVMGAWGFSGNIGAGYRPTIFPYLGPAGAPVSVLSIAAQNKPVQFPVVAGSEYFLEFVKNANTAGPESLRVRVEVAPLTSIANGNIIVTDDATGFPLAVLSQTVDNTNINFVDDMPAGEAGDMLPSGIWAHEEAADSTIKVVSSAFIVQSTSAAQVGTIRLRSARSGNKFYVGLSDNPNPVIVKTLSILGVFGVDHSLTGNTTIHSLCPTVGEDILYHAASGTNVPVRKWDLINDVQLANLAAGIAGSEIPDIIVLLDGTICALYHDTATHDVNVKHYSAAGAVLNTYALGVQTSSTKPRMAYASDDPTSIWVWTHNTLGVSKFRNITVATGAIPTTRTHTVYEGGAYGGAETATPTARFGSSFSCPFFIMVTAGRNGIYIFDPGKPNDTLNNGGVLTDVAIPDPTFRTGLLG